MRSGLCAQLRCFIRRGVQWQAGKNGSGVVAKNTHPELKMLKTETGEREERGTGVGGT